MPSRKKTAPAPSPATLAHWRACAQVAAKYTPADALLELAELVIQASDPHYTRHARFGAILRANRLEAQLALCTRPLAYGGPDEREQAADLITLRNALRHAESVFAERLG